MSIDETIDENKITRVAQLAEEFNLRLVIMFGSMAAGKSRPGSDMDIAIQFEKNEDVGEHSFDIMAGLQGIFPERKVDLALVNHADPLFLKKILENCELLYGKRRALAELRMYAFKRYVDHKRFLKMEEEYIRRLLRRHERGAA